jgi:hypothetical protein
LLVGVVGCLSGVLALGAGSANATTTSFMTRGCSTWSVPAGVESIQITAIGEAGEDRSDNPGTGGNGDVLTGTLSGLGAGQRLDVCVGYGEGAPGSDFAGAGGGAAGVALGSDFSDPVLIAAGGGGSGAAAQGGNAGNPAGTAGASVSAKGGAPGTQTAFGAGGAGDAPSADGANGAASTSAGPGVGGAGGNAGSGWGGGGGGAGYYGGGGGGDSALAPTGGGGGGSDLCPASTCQVTNRNASHSTTSVVFTYTVTKAPTSVVAAPQLVLFPPPNGVGLFEVSATVTSGGVGVSGETVRFTVGAAPLCSAVTGAGGVASCSVGLLGELQVLLANGYTATSMGDASHLGSTAGTPAIEVGNGLALLAHAGADHATLVWGTLTRAGRVYATLTSRTRHGTTSVRLKLQRRLSTGRYLLTIHTLGGEHLQRTITIT